MDVLVTLGAMASCTMGAAPAPIMLMPQPPVMAPTPVGTIASVVPFMNIMPFGVCISLANPAVAAATAAALGVLVPMPCVPVPVGLWAPGAPTVLMGGIPALGASNFLMCAWAGKISVSSSAQQKVGMQ